MLIISHAIKKEVKMPSAKKRLSQDQEFQILKIVLDKFLWIGTAILFLGIYQLVEKSFGYGLLWIFGGAIVLIIFVAILVAEYEITSY